MNASYPLVWPTAEVDFHRLEELRQQFHTAVLNSSFIEAIGEVQ